MTDPSTLLRQTYLLAAFSVPVVVVYAAAQTCIAVLVAPANAALRLVLEPYLLLLGLILHVQWRRVGGVFSSLGLNRPLWIVAADATSFVVTFWAVSVLVLAFLHEARLFPRG